VTIGGGTGGTPTLGDDVSVGTGATLIGGIHLGNQVIVGAGAVVTKDIPDNHLALGIPAKATPREV
jgi:serine O-acetyltransferase